MAAVSYTKSPNDLITSADMNIILEKIQEGTDTDGVKTYALNVENTSTKITKDGSGNMTFEDANAGPVSLNSLITAGGPWTRAASVTFLDNLGDTVSIGGSSATEKLEVVGSIQADDDLKMKNGTSFVFTLTGIPTAARSITFPDASDTVVTLGETQTLTSKTLTTPTIGDFTNANHNHQGAAGGSILSITLSTSGTLPETRGGTNQTTYTAGDILYASASNTLAKLAKGTDGQHLILSGGFPSWTSEVGDISEVLAGNGLTGGGTSGSVTVTMGTPGTITSSSTDAVTASSHTHAVDATIITTTDIQTMTNKTLTSPTIGDFSNAGHDHSNAAGGGTIAISDTTGTLTEGRGGTNQTTYTAGDILYASAANTLSKLAKGSDGEHLILASGLPAWSSEVGDISGVTAGAGLTGGGTSGAVTLDVGAGTGITVNANDIAADSSIVAFLANDQTFTNRQTITIADTSNVEGLVINQNDTTNNPSAMQINNAGSGHDVVINQTGVQDTSRYALHVYSNAVQVNSELFKVHQDNASSTYGNALFLNDGTGNALAVTQTGVLDGSRFALQVYSNTAQVNSGLVNLWMDNASSITTVLTVKNDGTGNGLFIDQNGNGIALNIDSEATETALEISISSINRPLNAENTSASGNGARFANTGITANQAFIIAMTNASSTGIVLDVQNTGTGRAINVTQTGVLANFTGAIDVTSATDQTNSNSALIRARQDNAASVGRVAYLIQDGDANLMYLEKNGTGAGTVLQITNTGTGTSMYVNQNADGRGIQVDSTATTKAAIKAYNNAIWTSAEGLLDIYLDNASATGPLVNLRHDGTGDSLFIDTNANGFSVHIDHEGTSKGAFKVDCDALTSGFACDIRSDSTSLGSTSRLLFLETTSALSQGIVAELKNGGTGTTLSIDHNGSTGAAMYINQIGDTYCINIVADTGTRAASKSAVRIFDQRDTTDSGFFSANVLIQGGNSANQTAPNVSLYTYAASPSNNLHLDHNASGYGIFIDSNNATNLALYIDGEQTAANVARIDVDVLTTGAGLVVDTNSSVFTGVGGSGLVLFRIDHTSATGTLLRLTNDGTGDAIHLDQNGDGRGLYVTTASTTAHAVRVDADSLTTGSGLWVSTNSAGFVSAAGQGLAFLRVDNASATGDVLRITNDGTGRSAHIDHNGNSIAVFIDSEATNQNVIDVDADALTTGHALSVSSSSLTSGLIANFTADNATFTGTVLLVNASDASGSGTGIKIDNNGTGQSLFIDTEGTATNCGLVIAADALVSERAFDVATANSGFTASGAVALGRFAVTNASASGTALLLSQAGTGDSLFVDHNNTGNAINVDMDATSASDMHCLKLAADNAGAGLEYAMYIASASLERSLGSGTTTKYLRVKDSGGSEYTIEMKSVA